MSVLYEVLRKSRLLLSVGVLIVLITVIFSAPVIAAPVAAPKVAIYAGNAMGTDVQTKLVATGMLSQVDLIEMTADVPTLTELMQYSAVLVYSDAGAFHDPVAWGDVLANYMDAGGGVVMAVFSFMFPPGDLGIGGRIISDGYLPFTQSETQSEASNLILVPDVPLHPILSGVESFNGGTSSYHNPVSLAAGASLIASWSDDCPLIATRERAVGRIVGLNFWPPSSTVRSDLWVASTGGARLMANSLVWAASTGPTLSAPTITSNGGGDTASIEVAENQAAVTTVTATDPDSTTLSFSKSGYDADQFNIDSSSGVLTFAVAADYEWLRDYNHDGEYNVTVTVSDGSLTDSQDLSVTIADVNDAPVITSNGGGETAFVDAVENRTAVTLVAAYDDDGNDLVYGIAGGADSGFFAIDSNGALSFKSAPDFQAKIDANKDGIYEVTVSVGDGSLVTTQAISVRVTEATPVERLENLESYITYDLQDNGLITKSTASGLIRVIDKAIDKVDTGDYAGAIKQLTSLKTTVQRLGPKKIASADSGYIVTQIDVVISRLSN